MQRNSAKNIMPRMLAFFWSALMLTTTSAGIPLWRFEPLTETTITVPANSNAVVQYRVRNQSARSHSLAMQPIQAVTQITTGIDVCKNPFVLRGGDSCILSLEINGSHLESSIMDGPVVCQQDHTNQCYRPAETDILRIMQVPPIMDAIISVTGSPLTLTANGQTGQLMINNLSTEVTATNITSDFTGTALDGNVAETANTCANLPPAGSCLLTYTPGNTAVPQTNFTIQGSNTNVLTAAIDIQLATSLTAINPNSGATSGGAAFTLTGTTLTGATSVTFDGVAATSINVINSTTVTGVTPAHAAGVVDIAIDTPAGSAVLPAGYTYITTAVGQTTGGGVVACLNGGLNNLIAATADNNRFIGDQWGPLGIAIGPGARSITDGASNTAAIVAVLGNYNGGDYAAKRCDNYEVDSQGNSPCQPGNTCYNDWFLPAGNNGTPSGQLFCLYTNSVAIGGFSNVQYWSSTELPNGFPDFAYVLHFNNGGEFGYNKQLGARVRCVRAFTP